MNISRQIKNYRKKFNISQEELSEKVHVSRQTISNWENDKSYPDLQSLVMLSEYFKISLDELVKGDVEKMKSELEKNQMMKFGGIMIISAVLMFLSLPIAIIFKPYGFILTGIFAFIMFWYSIRVEKVKMDKNLSTYKNIVAYLERGEIPEVKKEVNKKVYITKKVISTFVCGVVVYFLTRFIIEIFL